MNFNIITLFVITIFFLFHHSRSLQHLIYSKFSKPSRTLTSWNGFVSNKVKYFPYRATFNFECMFNSQTGLDDTEKVTWRAKHFPLSISVCSNVPSYSQPMRFVSNSDSKHLVKGMVDYLVDISKESYHLMKHEFFFLFQSIDETLEERVKEDILTTTFSKEGDIVEKDKDKYGWGREHRIRNRGGPCFHRQ